MKLAFFSELEKVVGEDYWRSVCESLKKNFQCCHLVTTVPGTWHNEEEMVGWACGTVFI